MIGTNSVTDLKDTATNASKLARGGADRGLQAVLRRFALAIGAVLFYN
jgi:hypothetical protein